MEVLKQYPVELMALGLGVVCALVVIARLFSRSDCEIDIEDPGSLYDLDALEAIRNGNPVADAMSALKAGDIRWLGFGTPMLEVPGVPDELRKQAPVRWLPGTGFGFTSDELTPLREDIERYVVRYNRVLVEHLGGRGAR